ncbi:MAG: ribose 1,5-bisphosphokinase [Arenicella sp.]|jgi:ribose 1,5-bisphosphokinase
MANLFYIIGASGAGKDSLINYLRDHLPNDAPVLFAHRYITRPADAGGEDHVALSTKEFEGRKKRGCFAMDWFSHDTHYGIGNEISLWLSQGEDVVVNGSREFLKEATALFPNLVPILIHVNPAVLKARLFARGRETAEQIQKRLVQATKLEEGMAQNKLLVIENNNRLEDAGEKLLNTILNWNK